VSSKDSPDIDQVIYDIAEFSRPRDRERLFELLRGRELFMPVASSTVPPEDGRQVVVGPGDQIKVNMAKLPNGMTCVVLFVDRQDSRLGPRCAGITVPEALDMVLKTSVDALLIQNSGNSWVAFPKQELPAIRTRYF
jgi:hypothetical protein